MTVDCAHRCEPDGESLETCSTVAGAPSEPPHEDGAGQLELLTDDEGFGHPSNASDLPTLLKGRVRTPLSTKARSRVRTPLSTKALAWAPPSPSAQDGSRGVWYRHYRRGAKESPPWSPVSDGSDPKSFVLSHGKVPREKRFEPSEAPVTTLMLRNLPNSMWNEDVAHMLNNHGFEGCYDFIYLPVDANTGWNVGYGFVNFKTSDDARRCRERLDRSFLGSRKIGVLNAKLQGRESNLEHYWHSAVTALGHGPMLL